MIHIKNFINSLNERSENWGKDYALLILYYYKHPENIDKEELIKLMKVSPGTFTAHTRQFVRLINDFNHPDKSKYPTDTGLGKEGLIFRDVFKKYYNLPEDELNKEVQPILDLLRKGFDNDSIKSKRYNDDRVSGYEIWKARQIRD